MATAFDSVGMGQLGSEKRYMTGDNPISQGLKGLKDFAILSAMDKSGLVGFLNDMGQSKKDMMAKYPGLAPAGAAQPPAAQAQPVSPVAPTEFANQESNSNAGNPFAGVPFNNTDQPSQKSIEDAADEAMGLSKSTSFVTPNMLNAPDMQSEGVLNRASQPAPPPGGMMLPQYGQKKSDGGSQIAGAVLSILPKLFGLG
jgi:hypothetical protein